MLLKDSDVDRRIGSCKRSVRSELMQERRVEAGSKRVLEPELWIVGERDDCTTGVDVAVDAAVVGRVPLGQRPVQSLRHVVRHSAQRRVTHEQYLPHTHTHTPV